jgi:hypothetical protein
LFCFERGSWYVVRLASNFQSFCLSLPSAGIIGTHHQAWFWLFKSFFCPITILLHGFQLYIF